MSALRDLVIGLVCALLGWLGCMWWHGLLLRSGAVAELTQETGERFVTADRAVTAATTELETTRERWRTVVREVPVPAECPPGAGPVSEPARLALADALRAAEVEP